MISNIATGFKTVFESFKGIIPSFRRGASRRRSVSLHKGKHEQPFDFLRQNVRRRCKFGNLLSGDIFKERTFSIENAIRSARDRYRILRRNNCTSKGMHAVHQQLEDVYRQCKIIRSLTECRKCSIAQAIMHFNLDFARQILRHTNITTVNVIPISNMIRVCINKCDMSRMRVYTNILGVKVTTHVSCFMNCVQNNTQIFCNTYLVSPSHLWILGR